MILDIILNELKYEEVECIQTVAMRLSKMMYTRCVCPPGEIDFKHPVDIVNGGRGLFNSCYKLTLGDIPLAMKIFKKFYFGGTEFGLTSRNINPNTHIKGYVDGMRHPGFRFIVRLREFDVKLSVWAHPTTYCQRTFIGVRYPVKPRPKHIHKLLGDADVNESMCIANIITNYINYTGTNFEWTYKALAELVQKEDK